MSKLRLYISTVSHLKPSQVAYRVWRKLGGKTPLRVGYVPRPDAAKTDVSSIPVLSELEFDPVFLARFDVDAILADRIELLHHEEWVDWRESWHAELSTPLWRFNLHYHEYLLPLAKAYMDTGDKRYFDKGKAIVAAWMAACPRAKGGVAWDPYVVSLRVASWLAFLGELSDELAEDEAFVARINASLAEQYVHLAQHLEKDLLANHYLENLKALVMLACHFNDERTLVLSLRELQKQVGEQILPDGMHFELSPMYHKIVLEDLLRAAAFLEMRGYDAGDLADRFRLQDVCDALWSMESNAARTPLFNDSGDNVAKGRDALLGCARNRFGIEPRFHSVLKDSGYCILERRTPAGFVKAIFDAGRPGPTYAMGHAHCDALSFECFIDGEPWIVNCGTYAYQDKRRLDFKRTLSHSTVCVEDAEQHECWAPFRVAEFSRAHLLEVGANHAEGALLQRGLGIKVKRTISLEDEGILVRDESEPASRISSAFVFAGEAPHVEGEVDSVSYAPEFGSARPARRVIADAQGGCRETWIPYPAFRQRGSR